MKFNPDIHHRHSIRLKEFDYSNPGSYFVTICTQQRNCLFGTITDGKMELNDAGRLIKKVWLELPLYYPNIDIDAFVVMPNHIHGIIIVKTGNKRIETKDFRIGKRNTRIGKGRPQGGAPHKR